MKLKIYLLLILATPSAFAQTQEDFSKKMSEVYVNAADKKKALELSKELLKMVEISKPLQTYSNYYILKIIFETQTPEETLAKKCKEQTDKLMAEMTSTATKYQPAANDANGQWNYVIMPDLFATSRPENATKGLDFLTKNPGLQNYNNYTFVGYAFERNGDFQKAKESYEKAMSLRGDDKKEFYSYSYYTNFLARSGDYLKAEDLLARMEKLSTEAVEMFRASYKSEAMNCRVAYFLSIGDYSSYVRAANTSYDYFSKTLTGGICDPYPMLRYTVTAYGNEMLKEYSLAERLWKKRDSTSTIYFDCNKVKFPNMQQPLPLSMLPVYQIKRGERKLLQKPAAFYVKETVDHYATYSQYADMSINYQKAVQLGFLGASQYPDVFKGVLDQIINSRNFRESTTPLAYYAYFTMRDRQFQKSMQTYDQLFKINVGWINDVIFSFGEKAFVSYYNTKLKDGYDDYHSLVKIVKASQPAFFPAASAQAYNNLLFTKSLSLKGTQKRKNAFRKANDPAVVKLYDTWIAKKEQLIRLYRKSEDQQAGAQAKPDSTINPEKIRALQTEVDHLENELTTKAKDFEKFLRIVPADWKSVRSRLKEDEAAIEMVRFQWRDQVYYSDTAYYAAYIVRHDSPYPEVVYLTTSANDLDNKFYKAYQNGIKFKVEDKGSYNRYWAPIKEQLKGIKKVFFSPDGIYHLISLPTLHNAESGKYLLDEIDLRYTTGTADVQASGNTEIKNAVLIGRPSYKVEKSEPVALAKSGLSTRSFVRNFRDNAINDLPGTEEEVKTIKNEMDKHAIRTDFLVRDQATEDKLYALRSPDVLHIATHGYWSSAGEDATDGYRLFNAMANSGLLLSGVVNYYSASQYPDTYDGILTAYEAQNLELENTSLVILSACETSLGHMDAGEGVYGLQRAFRAAGAKSIMTSLWKVDDEATKDFMILFYQELLRTQNKSEAFRSAQKGLKEKYPEPYYWGAFILTGAN